jgi:hypothetical protein
VRGNLVDEGHIFAAQIIRGTHCNAQVAVDGVWQTCPIGGGPIQFNGFNGLFLDLQRLELRAEIHSFIFHFCLTLKNQCKKTRNRIVGTTTWTSLMEKPLKE